MPIDFKATAQQLLAQARGILEQWYPAGRWRGREYVVGNLAGDAGDSLSINSVTGQWADFASGEKGGDLISLYAARHGLKQSEAAEKLGADISNTTPPAKAKKPAAAKASSVGMPPPSAKPPTFKHPKHGPATAHWTYRDAAGNPIFYISRHDPEGERKQILPWSWDTGRKKWRNLGQPKPRPPYGLDLLSHRPDDMVMVVEGEKAADAARKIAGHKYVVVTWPGGAKAIDTVDWSPLHGRKLLLWPDADKDHKYPTNHPKAGQVLPYHEQPGPACMLAIAGKLRPHCPEIKILDVRDVDHDGWDADDALAAGMDWPALLKWAKPRARICGEMPDPPNADPPNAEPDAKPEPQPQPDKNERSGIGLQIDRWFAMNLVLNSSGSPYPNLDNAVRVLERDDVLKGMVWWDEFSEKIFTVWDSEPREWTDSDDIRITLYYQRNIGITRMSTTTAKDAVVFFAKSQGQVRNAPREWMERLKWDGEPRLRELVTRGFGADETEYVVRVGECWMISIVARVFSPGCKVDTMPVFEGGQGIGKSSALRALGEDWFSECHEQITSKDFYGAIGGNFLIEISELHTFGRAEVDRIKGVISCQVDRYRAPYGRHAEDHPRKCVFAGTTNRSDWNRDDTGARRFWPIRCRGVDVHWITSHRDQLFAEAVARYRQGEAWWDVPAEAAAAEQEARRQADTWEEIIDDWVRDQETQGLMTNDFTVSEVLLGAIGLEPAKQDRVSQIRCTSALRLLGFESTTTRCADNSVRRVWRREEE